MDATIGNNTERVTGPDPAKRNEALDDARRRASQAALNTMEESEARKVEQREMVRAILEEAVGANTRLAIAKNDQAGVFVYQAIDVSSGDVVKEWPPVQFARFLEQHGGVTGVTEENITGLMLDELA